MSTATKTLLPWYLGYQGGDSNEAIQCMAAGDNGYHDNQAALNYGLNNHWARNNTPWSWGYYKREDIPVQFAIAEGWTSGDMYQVQLRHFHIIGRCMLIREQESQITSTNPNRVTLVSGSVNVPGSPQNSNQGGVYIDNNEMPGMSSFGAPSFFAYFN
jgi:phospholipase C